MRCYAPGVGTVVALIAVGYGLLHRVIGQAFAAAGPITGLVAAAAGLAAALAVVAVSAAAVRRRRAAAGACTTCRFRCQQAIPQPRRAPGVPVRALPVPRRPVLVARYDRGDTVAPVPQWPQWPHRPLTRAPQPRSHDPRCGHTVPDGTGAAARAIGITARAVTAPTAARERRDAARNTGVRSAEYCGTTAADQGLMTAAGRIGTDL